MADNIRPLNPKFDTTLQFYALLYSASRFDFNYDAFLEDDANLDFRDLIRVWPKGHGSGYDLPEERLMEFEDPFTGATWQAISFINKDGEEIGVASKVLAHAEELKQKYLAYKDAEPGTTEYILGRRAGRDLSQFMDKVKFMADYTYFSTIFESLDYWD